MRVCGLSIIDFAEDFQEWPNVVGFREVADVKRQAHGKTMEEIIMEFMCFINARGRPNWWVLVLMSDGGGSGSGSVVISYSLNLGHH